MRRGADAAALFSVRAKPARVSPLTFDGRRRAPTARASPERSTGKERRGPARLGGKMIGKVLLGLDTSPAAILAVD